MKYLIILFALIFASCSTIDEGLDVREKTLLISYGDTKEKVKEILGMPGDRSFLGKEEAWQYCSSVSYNDVYYTVWFNDGFVTGVTNKVEELSWAGCNQHFPQIDWGQVQPDKKIDINIKSD